MAGIIENKLMSKNYSTWKFKLKHLLIAKELWGYFWWLYNWTWRIS